jgi:hypothetical protein
MIQYRIVLFSSHYSFFPTGALCPNVFENKQKFIFLPAKFTKAPTDWALFLFTPDAAARHARDFSLMQEASILPPRADYSRLAAIVLRNAWLSAA